MIDDYNQNKDGLLPPPVEPTRPVVPAENPEIKELQSMFPVEEHSPLTKAPPPVNAFERRVTKSQRAKSIISTIVLLISAPIIALLLTNYVFQSYQVDGPSMENTLQNGNRLIVLKTGHTWARISGTPYMPKRAEIVVFVKHGLYEAGTSHEKQLIKRVIGLPGDRVVAKDGVFTVYNDDNKNGFNPDLESSYADAIHETQGNAEWNVGPGQVFVAGDNRNNSLDSRSFGPIEVKDIVGKLAIRILPLSKARVF